MPKLSSISNYLGYSVSFITFIFGTVVLSGLVFQYVPDKLRILFGVVLILWGIYRFVFTRIHVRQQREKDEEE
jgi:cytochrome c biogenesis protein CcdA